MAKTGRTAPRTTALLMKPMFQVNGVPGRNPSHGNKKDTTTVVKPKNAVVSAMNYVVNGMNGTSIHSSTPMPDVWSRYGNLALLRLLAVAVGGLVWCP